MLSAVSPFCVVDCRVAFVGQENLENWPFDNLRNSPGMNFLDKTPIVGMDLRNLNIR